MSPRRLPVAYSNIEHRFEWIKTIDSGVYGEEVNEGPGKGNLNAGVFIVRRKSDGKVLVEKRIPLERQLLREIRYLRRLHHPSICRYVDAFICKKSGFAGLYMKYCDLGTMDGVLDKYCDHAAQQARIPEPFIWKTLYSIADALQYIHHGIDSTTSLTAPQGWFTILHCDIKPSNIFIRKRPNVPLAGNYYPRLILGDFGVAVSNAPEDRELWENRDDNNRGTPAFHPPEAPEHSFYSDIWALGATIQCMCRCEQSPLHDPPRGIDYRIWDRNPRSRYPKGISTFYSDYLADLLNSVMAVNKSDRPLAPDLWKMARRDYKLASMEFERFPTWVFEGMGDD